MSKDISTLFKTFGRQPLENLSIKTKKNVFSNFTGISGLSLLLGKYLAQGGARQLLCSR